MQAAETLERHDMLEAARALAPQLRVRAARTDADRRLPQETIRELSAAGLFGILKPRVFGGAELGVGALVEVTAELAAACGSTGWVFGVLAGHSWLLNLFPVEAQREVFADPEALTATLFRLNATVTRSRKGFRLVRGEGRFCSGIDHAKWVMVGAAVADGNGAPERRFFLVPRAEIEVVDDWFTVGMRGTGSRSIRIADAFVPEHRSLTFHALVTGKTPGGKFHAAPIYRLPFQIVTPFSLIGAPLGIARGVFETFCTDLSPWVAKLGESETMGKSAMFARIAHAGTEIDAARALVLADAARIDSATDTSAPAALESTRVSRNWAYAAQTSRGAVARLFEAAGGTVVYEGSAVQRSWRDVNAAAQHYAFVWDNAMVDFGRALFNLPPLNTGPGSSAGRKPA